MTVKPQSPRAMRLFPHGLLFTSALLLVSACSEPLDFDLRGNFGKAPSTAAAARQATANRPKPDDRGIISYPGYQVAVARRGDKPDAVAWFIRNRGLVRMRAPSPGITVCNRVIAYVRARLLRFRRALLNPRRRRGQLPQARYNRQATSISRHWRAMRLIALRRLSKQRRLRRKSGLNRQDIRSHAARPPIPWRGSTMSRCGLWPNGTGLAPISPCVRGSIS